MRALLVGYGRMGRAIEAVLVARGHSVVGRFEERIERREEICLDSEEEIEENRREICLEGNPDKGAPGAGSAGAPQVAPPPSSPSKRILVSSSSSASSSSLDLPECDIAFEFTAPDAAPALISLLLSKKIPVLSGTTGWDVSQAAHEAREQRVPFLHSSNFSLGVAALRLGVEAVARALAPFPEFEPGILERHHVKKKDSPSGTAKMLASTLESASGRGRVPIASLRQGAMPGEHLVIFEGEDETLELVHRARSRAIFAQGAVRAAEWMLKSGPKGPLTFEEFFNDVSRGGNTP